MHGKSVRIRAPCRVHFGLISMTHRASRAYGGAGITLWHVPTVVHARSSGDQDVTVDGQDSAIAAEVPELLESAGIRGVCVHIEAAAERHIGLGSRTSLNLACIEASMLAIGYSADRECVVRASGRGGASGIGVNSYFEGGVIADVGHAHLGGQTFLPSSHRKPDRAPGKLFRLEWPHIWSIFLVYPRGLQGPHGADEARLFETSTPLCREDCGLTAMALLLELPGALMNADFSGLRWALIRSRQAGFKPSRLLVTRLCNNCSNSSMSKKTSWSP